VNNHGDQTGRWYVQAFFINGSVYVLSLYDSRSEADEFVSSLLRA
jgi:hypothetical protein